MSDFASSPSGGAPAPTDRPGDSPAPVLDRVALAPAWGAGVGEGPAILVVDDEEMNVNLLRRVLQRGGYERVVTVTDPRNAPEAWSEAPPDLLLLDLHMPHRDGFDLLREYRSTCAAGEFRPVVMLTGDQERAVRERALADGATDFLTKPFDLAEALLRIGNLLETRRLYLALERYSRALEARVAERTQALVATQLDMLQRLARTAELRDDLTGEHTRRVGTDAGRLAAAAGLDADDVERIRLAAPLHDIGKIGIPDAILLKPGRLTPEEYTVMQRHTLIGATLLAEAGSAELRLAESIALSHHERWDGGGYPQRLAGAAIPLAARIVAIVDFWDALTHDRPYRAAVPIARVIEMMRAESGRHFDPVLLEHFLAHCV